MSGMDILTDEELIAGWDDLKDNLSSNGHDAAEVLFDYGDKLADALSRRASQAAPADDSYKQRIKALAGLIKHRNNDGKGERSLFDHVKELVELEKAAPAPALSDGLREEANAVLAGLGPVHGKLMYEGYEGSANAVMNAADWIRAAISESPAKKKE